jgi:hypothetical protein
MCQRLSLMISTALRHISDGAQWHGFFSDHNVLTPIFIFDRNDTFLICPGLGQVQRLAIYLILTNR